MAKPRPDQKLVTALQKGEGPESAAGWLESGDPSAFGAVLSEGEELALSAVEAALGLARVEALAVLDAGWSGAGLARSKVVQKAVRKALHRLRSQGVVVPEQEQAAHTWSVSSEVLDIPAPAALMGMPQGDGYVPFVIVAYGRSGGVVCAGTFGAAQGYQDEDHAHVGRAQAREILARSQAEHGLYSVPVHVALHFAERAFSEGGRTPKGWDHMTELLDEGLRSSAQLLDPLAGQPDQLDVDAMHRTDALGDGPEAEMGLGLFIALTDAVAESGMQEIFAALSSPLELDDAARRARIEGAINATSDRVVAGSSRATWILAMDVVTWIATVAEQEDRAMAARHTALALRADRAGHQVPFVRMWTERQLALAAETARSIAGDGGLAGRLAELKPKGQTDPA